MVRFPKIEEAIRSADTVQLRCLDAGPYDSKILQFGERGSYIGSELRNEIITGLCDSIRCQPLGFDYIVSPEPGGNQWGLLAADRLDKPLNILRTTMSHLEGEYYLPRSNGFLEKLYFNNFEEGNKFVVVDTIANTGETLETIFMAAQRLQVECVGVHLIYAKTEEYKKLQERFGVPINALVYQSELENS